MASHPEPVAIGEVLDERYEIRGKLGEGGFAFVYLAHQRATGQQVAVKVMRAVVGIDPTVTHFERFQREMRVVGRLNHPNIVGLIDTGREGEVIYSVFEYVRGVTLARHLQECGRLKPADATHLMMQVLDALSAAHALGIVHRDLKPLNVMVSSTGARRNAKVLDFGLAAVIREFREEHYASVTDTGSYLGTAAYAAPEQLTGQKVGAHADLFSWGLLFAECLIGERVMRGKNLADYVGAAMSKQPVPLPAALRAHPLGAVIARVLAKDPQARPASAADVLAELQNVNPGTESIPLGSGAEDTIDLDEETVVSVLMPGLTGPVSRSASVGLTAERRQITVLSADLFCGALGSAALSPEDLDEIQPRLVAACREAVESAGGYAAPAQGSTFVAYFGFPRASGDDAVRAARSALAIIDRVRAEAEVLRRERQCEATVGIGIHTGVVVARSEPNSQAVSVVGEAETVARRLAAIVDSNSAAVSSSTRELLRERFEITSLGMRSLRGVAQPLAIHSLIAEVRGEASSAGLTSAGLIGRGEDLDLLSEAWRQVVSGSRQAILLSGDAGLGKTRLLQGFRAELGADPHLWLERSATPEAQKSPLQPITLLLAAMLGAEGPAGDAWERLDGLIGQTPDRAKAHSHDAALLGALLGLPPDSAHPLPDWSPPLRRENTFAALRRLLEHATTDQPVILTIEDLQWADPSTLDFIGRLLEGASRARLLVLLTARPEFRPSWTQAAMLRVPLKRLSQADIEEVIKSAAGGELPEIVMRGLITRSDGIPLFAEELARMLAASEALTLRRGRYVLRQPNVTPTIPNTIHGFLTARLDQAGEAREIARLAAVIGREFTLSQLQDLTPLPPAQLRAQLDSLVGTQILSARGRQADPVYAFRHALLQESAYDSLLRDQRIACHLLVAQSLERTTDGARSRPAVLAHHFAAAELYDRGIEYALAACRLALSQSANSEVIAQTNSALDWLSRLSDEAERARLELELRSTELPALMATLGYGAVEIEESCSRSLTLVETVGLVPTTFPVLWSLVSYYQLRGRFAEARQSAQRNLTIAREAKDSGLELEARNSIAVCDWFAGRLREAVAELETAEALYDPSQHASHALIYGQDPKVFAEAYRFVALRHLGHVNQARELARQSMAFAEESGHANTLALALLFYGVLLQYEESFDDAAGIADRLLALCTKHGLQQWSVLATMLHTWAEVMRGSSDDLAPLHHGVGLYAAIGANMGMTFWKSLLAEAQAKRGEVAKAVATVRECIQSARDGDERFYLPQLHRLEARWQALLDDPAGAEKSYRASIAEARSQGAAQTQLASAVDLARFLSARGDASEAIASLSEACSVYPEEGAMLADARSLLGELSKPDTQSL